MIGQGRPIFWQCFLALTLGLGGFAIQSTLGDQVAPLFSPPRFDAVEVVTSTAVSNNTDQNLELALPGPEVQQTSPPRSSDASSPATLMRLRISFGGNTPEKLQRWRGLFSLSHGHLHDHVSLGYEADEPGSMWVQNGRFHIEQRSLRYHDAVDISVSSDLEAVLTVQFTSIDQTLPTAPIEIPVADLLAANPLSFAIDDHGNQLQIQRAPGDMLRLHHQRENMVFAPGESLPLELQPHLLPVADGSTIHFKVQLQKARTGVVLSTQEHKATISTGIPTAAIPLTIDTPTEEGVYELTIEAAQRGLLRWNRSWNKPVAERRLQFVVVDPQKPQASAGSDWTEIAVIDASNPKWWERLRLNRFQSSQRTPLNNQQTQTWNHPLGQMMQLGPGGQGSNISWEAFVLSLQRTGVPHLVEIEYPSDVPQSLGVSVLEPNAAGEIVPGGLDSGFYVGTELANEAAKLKTHRLVFWPRTRNPLLLLTNRRDGTYATFGKIRIYAGPEHLPQAKSASTSTQNSASPQITASLPKRLIAGYLNRPLFPENFSASEFLDRSGRSLDDWQTFYEGGTRLIEYLNYAGKNALVLSVLADGSAIYPSQVVESTPRYDTGAFIDLATDPMRKDVLELLFRLFDRAELRLIPSVQFAAPLPRLEALLRDPDFDSTGITLIGRDGQPWTHVQQERGLAPYYNPLNEHVQAAMLEVTREIVQRYASHRSFAGLAVELSTSGYAQVPSELWGLDDRTIARFERESGVELSFTGPERFEQRAVALNTPGVLRTQWIAWRSTTLAKFYRQLAQEITQLRPDAKVYLCGVHLFDTPELQADLSPTLPPGRLKLDDLLSRIGFRAEDYATEPAIVFIRPHHISPPTSLAAEAQHMQLESAAESHQATSLSWVRGSLLYHVPQKTRLESFDRKSPFGASKTYTWLVSQMQPSGEIGRKHFVNSLAARDTEAIFDGGWLLGLGQEDAVRDLALAYQQLPAVPFNEVFKNKRPITARIYRDQTNTYVYFVNDTPWPVTFSANMQVPTGCVMEELSGQRPLRMPQSGLWQVPIEAYDFIAVRFNSSTITLSDPKVDWHNDLQQHLAQQIRDLGARVAALANSPLNSLVANADFGLPSANPHVIPNWEVQSNAPHGQIVLTPGMGPDGSQAVQLTSSGQAVSIRQMLATPKSGRIDIFTTLKCQNISDSASVQIVIHGTYQGLPFRRFAEIRVSEHLLEDKWKTFSFSVDDLPPVGLSQLAVALHFQGQGQLWIDNVQVYDLKYLQDKHRELLKLVASADSQLTAGNIADCLHLLDSYWPRFLQENIPLEQSAMASTGLTLAQPKTEASSAPKGSAPKATTSQTTPAPNVAQEESPKPANRIRRFFRF